MKDNICQYGTKRLLRGYNDMKKASIKVLDKYYGYYQAEKIKEESSLEYEEIMCKIPYIGGSENSLAGNLINSAQLLSFIISLNKREKNEYKIGKIIYEIGREYTDSFNSLFIKIGRVFLFSHPRLAKLAKRAEESNKCKYPGDWIYDFVNGETGEFVYGIDYKECGIFKFYSSMGYEGFVKYVCLLDYLIFKRFGVRLERTKTIGNGEKICDFRFYRKGKQADAWPPEELVEFKG